jgi:oxygen-dependent protoporphyrinogen oxidase
VRYVRYIVAKLALSEIPREPAISVGIPSSVDQDLCTLSLDHNKAADRCPPGKAMVSVYWHVDWTDANWDQPDDDIARRSTGAAASVLGPLDVEFCHVARWDPAWVLPAPGGYRDMQLLARHRGTAKRVHLAGDYFGGSTTNSALCSGLRAAANAEERLGAAERTSADAGPVTGGQRSR